MRLGCGEARADGDQAKRAERGDLRCGTSDIRRNVSVRAPMRFAACAIQLKSMFPPNTPPDEESGELVLKNLADRALPEINSAFSRGGPLLLQIPPAPGALMPRQSGVPKAVLDTPLRRAPTPLYPQRYMESPKNDASSDCVNFDIRSIF